MNIWRKIPDRLRGVLLWLVGFALLLIAFQWEGMHRLDASLASWMQSTDVPFSEQVVLLDVPLTLRNPKNPEDQCPDKNFRGDVGAMLQLLARKNTPSVVALDIAFSSACDSNDGGVAAGVKALTDKGVAMFGVFGLDTKDDKPDSRSFHEHVKPIYDKLDATGQSWFGQAVDVGGLWPVYLPCLWVQSQRDPSSPHREETLLMSLPLLATGIRYDCEKPMPGDEPERWRVPIAGKLSQVVPSQLLHFERNNTQCAGQWRNALGECLADESELKGKLVIVGNLEHDQPYARDAGPYKDISGPETVAWAISDLKLRGDSGRARVLVNIPGLYFGLSLVTALLAFGMFFGLQKVVPALSNSSWRRALLALLLGMLLPLVLVGSARLFHYDYSQILLPVLTTALTLALAVRHHVKVKAHVASKPSAQKKTDFSGYLIFVSYRHNQSDWVNGTLMPMLKKMSGRNGESLPVFIDNDEIHAGQDWKEQLAAPLNQAPIFLALLTSDYFELNARSVSVCKWEMDWALARHAHNAMTILPIFHDGYDPADPALSKEYAALQAIHGLYSHNEALEDKLYTSVLATLDKIRPCK